ncbi:hypothetical protein JD844_013296, partial [Phrynosoma platyrhinos]
MWWDRYRSPAAYPSSDSTNSGDDQESEVEDEKPQRGSHRVTILHRNLLDISKGNGSNGLKQREAFRNGSQLKKPPRSQLGKLNSAESNHVGENMTKEKAVGEEQQKHCFICNRTFKSMVSLSNHQRIHPGAKTYECCSCGETFTVKKKLFEHLKRHGKEGKDPLLVMGERSKMEDSEQVQAELSKIPKRNVLYKHREAEVPVSQVVKSERNLRIKNNATLHYKQDKHYIDQQLQPKQTNLQTCKKEKLHVDLQLRSQTMSRRTSMRGMQLPSRRARSCICQDERLEMTNRKKSPNAKICKKVKACNSAQRDSSATVSSRLLKSAPKSCMPERPGLSMPSHSTVSGESKMETTESIGQGNSACTEQQRDLQEVLEKKQEDFQSCGPDT